jgi:DNA-binding SARP family transcriptional activator
MGKQMHHTFQILGPVRVVRGHEAIPAGGPKQRTLLLALLLNLNRPVSLEWLTDALWEDEPPASATANLRSYVNTLRRALSGLDVEINGRGRSYQILVDPEWLDLTSFERAVGDGRSALGRGDFTTAAARLRQAIGLWRGPAGHDTRCGQSMDARLAALRERYATTVEDHAEAMIALGGGADAAFNLRVLLSEQPLRERSWELLVRALHGAGDTAGALCAYAEARSRLVDELGIEPGEELRRVHQSVLGRAPRPAPAQSLPPRSQRRCGTCSTAGQRVAGLDAVVERRRPVPRQLPRPLLFVGREQRTRHAVAALTRERRFTSVLAISGPADVGKSALALATAHAIRDRFPDGQLYVDLHDRADGAYPPTSSRRLLSRLLTALGEPPPAPDSVAEEHAARLRSVTADLRLLLVLDGAPEAALVRPLLPSGPHCAVLITARHRLALDYAEHLELEPFTHREALDLLAESVGAQRVAASPEAAHEIARHCAHSPLALRQVGELLSTEQDVALPRLSAQLREDGASLGRTRRLLAPVVRRPN